jgi:hypothetical protein
VSYRDILRGRFEFDDNTVVYGKPFVNMLLAKSNLARPAPPLADLHPIDKHCDIPATGPNEAVWTVAKPWQ